MTGFLEESPGVRSMARLTMAAALAMVAAVVGVTVFHVVRGAPDGGVVAGLAAMVSALVGTAAFIKRGGGEGEG